MAKIIKLTYGEWVEWVKDWNDPFLDNTTDEYTAKQYADEEVEGWITYFSTNVPGFSSGNPTSTPPKPF